MKADEELTQLRESINHIDAEIFKLIRKRFDVAKKIADIKLKHGLPIKVFGVEKRVLEKNQKIGEELGLYTELVERATKLMIRYSVISQDEYHTRVRSNGLGNGKKIVIIGGRGLMGQWLDGFFSSFHHDVKTFDKSDFGVDPFANASFKEAVGNADFVALATPMSATSHWIGFLAEQKVGAVVFDICSLKSPILSAQKSAIANGLKLASTHPMFGPNVETLSGRNIVFSDCGNAKALAAVETLFAESTATKLRLGCEDHDRCISLVLGFSHFINLLFAQVLRESGMSLEQLSSTASTTFANQMRITRAVTDENAQLYFEIQEHNQYSGELFKLVREQMDTLIEQIGKGHKEEFIASMQKSRDFFKNSK